MKKWWTETGWPWLKENWYLLLIFPVVALTYAGYRFFKFFPNPVVDPLLNADTQAREEAKKRIEELEKENERLTKELVSIRAEYDAKEQKLLETLSNSVETLRGDPQKLRDAMLRAGRP